MPKRIQRKRTKGWKMLNYIVWGINWSATTYGAIKGVFELCKKELEIYSTKNINP